MSDHILTNEGDEVACSCGLRWEYGESDPHAAALEEHTVHKTRAIPPTTFITTPEEHMARIRAMLDR